MKYQAKSSLEKKSIALKQSLIAGMITGKLLTSFESPAGNL